MKHLLVTTALAAFLLSAIACSSSTNTNTNSNTARPAQSPATTNSAAANSSAANTSAPADQGAQDFTLVNKTGVEIDKLFISPHDADDWEEDILGRDTLPSGDSLEIKFHRSETAPMWDMRIEDKQGNAIEWESLNLLKISKVTLHYENGKATAEVE